MDRAHVSQVLIALSSMFLQYDFKKLICVKISPELKFLKKLNGMEIVLKIIAASSFKINFETIFCVIKIFIILKKYSLIVEVSKKIPISVKIFKFSSSTIVEKINFTIFGVIRPRKVKIIEVINSITTSMIEISFFK